MSDRNPLSEYTAYLSIGAEIAAAVAFPILLGYWLDSYFDTEPWLILAGSLIGIVNVMVLIFRLADRLNRDKK